MTEPFKGLALGVFLITVGMSLDLDQVWNRIWEVTLAVVAVLGIKAVVTGAILRMRGARTGMSTETGSRLASRRLVRAWTRPAVSVTRTC